MRRWRMAMAGSAAALPVLFALGCGSGFIEETHVFTGETMGTTYTVKVAEKDVDTGKVKETIAEVLERIDRSMSTWRPDSELSKFNASRDTAPVKVSTDLLEVLSAAREVSEASGGAFDVTVAPLVNVWGFGKGPVPQRVPSDEDIAQAKARVGCEKLELDAAAGTLRKSVPDLEVDVAAIAPGYGSDEIAEALERLGYKNYMVELGGEVRAAGRKNDGNLWNIAIERPDASGREVYRAIQLADESLSTSGDYRDYYEREGVRYSHTIDPRTGRPIAHKLASVSVIYKDCMRADAWATALDVLGPEEGYRLAVEKGMPALFLVRESPGMFTERMTPAFEARTQTPAGSASPGR